MRTIIRNPATKAKITPESLPNTRNPAEYKKAIVADHNKRWGGAWRIDPAKAYVIAVRKNSFRPWEAECELGENIIGTDGNVIRVNKRRVTITREQLPDVETVVNRKPGDGPITLTRAVEKALGLEENELVAPPTLSSTVEKLILHVNPNSLNLYGTVRIKVTYDES